MKITVEVEEETGLFLKQEMGSGTIGNDKVRFGICPPTGTPYIHVRDKYYTVSKIFETMLRAIHKEESCTP